MSYWLQFTPWGPSLTDAQPFLSHSETHDIVKSSKMVGIFDNKLNCLSISCAPDIVLTTPFISVSLMPWGRYMVTDLPVGNLGLGNVKA